MRVLSALILAGAMAAAGCDSPRSELEPRDLQLAVKAFTSLAAEAELLASELDDGNVSADFATVHQQALGDDSLKLAKDIAKPAPENLRAAHEALTLLNARLRLDVARIAQARGHDGELSRLQKEFGRLGAEAAALGGA